MCGIWAIRPAAGTSPDPELTIRLARENARRGPHAHGHAYHAARTPGIPAIHRALGPPGLCIDRLADTIRTPPAGIGPVGAIIGHSRLATTGPRSQHNLEDVQPIRGPGLLLAHNGTIPHPDRTIAEHDLTPRTGNDSEILALLTARHLTDDPDPDRAIDLTIRDALPDRHPFALIILTDTGELHAARRTLPLHADHTAMRTALSSRQLPNFLPILEHP